MASAEAEGRVHISHITDLREDSVALNPRPISVSNTDDFEVMGLAGTNRSAGVIARDGRRDGRDLPLAIEEGYGERVSR